MKILGYKLGIKQVAIMLVILMFMTTLQLFVLYMYRLHGDLDFYDWEHLVFSFLSYVVSVISTVYAWIVISKNKKKVVLLDTVKAFFLSCIFFMLFEGGLDFLSRLFAGGTKSFWSFVVNTFAVMIMFHLYLSGFVLAIINMLESQKSAVAAERAEKEKEHLQSQMLQKNLEPHFLFNNLSVMSGLARKRPEHLEDFIDDFSDVYRYYLRHGQEKIVSLEEELDFISSYMNLMKKRFGGAYILKNTIHNTSGSVLPTSIQLCIENAIKHNKASADRPLVIEVSREGDIVIVKNPINRVDFTLGTGIGNDYLKRQYKMQFGKAVRFEEKEDTYAVYIPIIKNT